MPDLHFDVIRLPIAASDCLAAGTPATAPGNSASPVTSTQRLPSFTASPAAEASQKAPSTPLHQFEFISEKDEASRRRARAHVMRDFMRKRRQREVEHYRARQQGNSPSTATTDLPDPLAFVTPTAGDQPSTAGSTLASASTQTFETSAIPDVVTGQEKNSGEAYGQLESAPSSEGLPSAVAVVTSAVGASPASIQRGGGASPSPASPLSALSPSPVDPFASLTLPLSPSASEQELIHHCIKTIPSRRFGVQSPENLSPFRSLLQLWGQRKSPLGFQGLLCYTAVHIAVLRGTPDAPFALSSKTKLIRSVNESLRASPLEDVPSLLFAISSLANVENTTGTLVSLSTHYNAARSIIQSAGGLQGLIVSNTPVMARHLFCTIMTVEILQRQTASTDWGLSWDGSALSPISSTFFDANPQPGSSHPSAQHSTAEIPALGQNFPKAQIASYIFGQFTSFLHICAQNARTNCALPFQQQIPSTSTSRVITTTTLTTLSPLHQLSLTIRPIIAADNIHSSATLPRSHPHLALLIFFNLIAWSLRHNPSVLLRWLEKLALDLSQYDAGTTSNYNGFLVMLAWREDTEAARGGVDERWVWWFTARLTRMCKRLSDDAWGRVRGFLMSCLLIEGKGEARVESIGLEEVRKEVLGRGQGSGTMSS